MDAQRIDRRLAGLLLGGVLGLALVVVVAAVRPPGSAADPFLDPIGGPVASYPPRMDVAGVYARFADLGDALVYEEPVELAAEDAGELVLPSGRVVVADVYFFDDQPLARVVPAGRYPVTLLAARYPDDERIAAGMIRVGPGSPVRWEPAVPAGVDPESLDPEAFVSFGVDSGSAAFAAAEAVERLVKGNEVIWTAYGDEVMHQMFPSENEYRHLARIELDPVTGANVVAFSSGFGDGGYPAWFGLDAAGEPVVLMIDFGLLDAPGSG